MTSPGRQTAAVVLATAGMTLALIGLVAQGFLSDWTDLAVLAPLGVGGLMLIASGILRWRLASVAVMPLGLVLIAKAFFTLRALLPPVAETMDWTLLKTPEVLLPLLLGGLLLFLPLGLNAGIVLRKLIEHRGREGIRLVVAILAAGVLVVAVNGLSRRHYLEMDVTQTGRFSLSPRTREILAAVQHPLRMTTMFDRETRQFRLIARLLERMQRYCRRLEVEHLFGRETDPGAVQVEMLGRKELVSYRRLFRTGRPTPEQPRPRPVAFTGEEALALTILKLVQPQRPVVYLTQGHGEKAPTMPDVRRTLEALEDHGMQFRPITLPNATGIPEDGDLLVIIGPTKPFDERARGQIVEFVETRRGRLVALLDPVDEKTSASGLEPVLAKWNLRVESMLTVFEEGPDGKSSAVFEAGRFVPELSSGRVAGQPVSIDRACPVSVRSPDDRRARYVGGTLLATGPKAHRQRTLPGGKGYARSPGPKSGVSLAAAIQEQPPADYSKDAPFAGARIVVFGDSDLLGRDTLAGGWKPSPFVLQVFRWAVEREIWLDIPVQPWAERTITALPQHQDVVFWVSVVGLPYLAVVIGWIVYWVRRQ